MKITIPLAGVLLCAASLAAQDAAPPQAADADARLEALQKEFQSVVREWRKAVTAAQEAAEKAKESGEAVPAIPMRPDFSTLLPKYQAAAEDFAGTDDAVKFLVPLIQYSAQSEPEVAKQAVQTLADAHAASSAIAKVAPMMQYLPDMVGKDTAQSLIDAVRAQNKDPDVIGYMLLAEHADTIDNADRDSDEYGAAKAALLAAAENVTDKRLRGQLTQKIDLREKYGVGNTAPDIEGIDLDGVEFKLSDYKGKVVFLDFWGDW